MGLLDWLARSGDEADDPGRTEVVRLIGAALAGLPPERARFVAAFAYLLGRVAHADHELTPTEMALMERQVAVIGGIRDEEARAVVGVAQVQRRVLRGTEDFRVAREFGALATHEEKLALVRCLFAVSASDDSVVTAEDNEIRRITMELKIPHDEFVRARAEVRDRLAVLKGE